MQKPHSRSKIYKTWLKSVTILPFLRIPLESKDSNRIFVFIFFIWLTKIGPRKWFASMLIDFISFEPMLNIWVKDSVRRRPQASSLRDRHENTTHQRTTPNKELNQEKAARISNLELWGMLASFFAVLCRVWFLARVVSRRDFLSTFLFTQKGGRGVARERAVQFMCSLTW